MSKYFNQNYIYVLNQNGEPLMPTKRFKKVRKILKSGEAILVSETPATIQLTYETTNETQPLTLGIDPGRSNIGMAVINDQGTCLYACHLETRNKEIPKLMSQRKGFRQAHRRLGRRKVRQRRACVAQPELKDKVIERHLPGYGEDKIVSCKSIKNKEARFNNRKRPEGWLTPTARQLLQTHVNLVKKILKILPVTSLVIEINKFSFMKLEKPDIRPWEYSKGSLYGYKDLHEAVDDIQDGKCLLCGKNDIDHYHHVKPRSEGGADTIDNIAGLCTRCHDKVHKDEKATAKLETKKAGIYKKYHATTILNQIMPQLLEALSELLPTEVTDGRTTDAFRTYFGVDKEHYSDAYCIACSALEREPFCSSIKDIVPFELKQYRRHNRQACYKQNLNRVYIDSDGNKVAVNRHRATEQKKNISLAEYRNAHTDKNISQLRVKPHKPVYVNMDRAYPGAQMYDIKKKVHFVLQGTVSGQYNDVAENIHNKSNTKLLKQNTGLVILNNPTLQLNGRFEF